MAEYLTFALLGLGSGAVYAALGTSLVITYRTSGVLNFAAGATAMYSAFVYAHLRATGDYFSPVPGTPALIGTTGPMGLLPALLIAVLTAVILCLAMYLLIFRFLRDALPLAKLVASLGLMLLLQGIVTIRLSNSPVNVEPIFPASTFSVGSITVPKDRLWLSAVLLAMAIGFWLLARFTPFGLATRALADSERGARLVGIGPHAVAAVNWAISGVLAGVMGVLIASIVPPQPETYTLFIIPALAAALFGKFALLAPTIAAAFLIGILQSEVGLLSSKSWFPDVLASGTPELLPVIAIAIALAFRGNGIPARGFVAAKTLPWAPYPRHVVPGMAALVGAAVLGLVLLEGGYRYALFTSLIMTILALSIVVITGFVGQISLVQLVLAGASAYLLVRFSSAWEVPFPFNLLLAAVGAALIGCFVGLPALRVRGISLAVITIAGGAAIEAFYFQNIKLSGETGTVALEGPTWLGMDLSIGSGDSYPRVQFGLVLLVVLVLALLLTVGVRSSRLGNYFLAVRGNERSAAMLGINVTAMKMIAFALSSFLAGLAGGLLAYQQRIVTPDTYTSFASISFFALVYLCGISSMTGAIVAGVFAPHGVFNQFLDRTFEFGEWYQVVLAALLILTAIVEPSGVSGRYQEMAQSRRQRARRLTSATPTAVR